MRPGIDRAEIEIARVTRGSVDETLQASGTVLPVAEQIVSSPVEARLLRIGRRAGDVVRPGDELLTLDTTAARLDLDRLGERVAKAASEQTQLRMRLDDNLATLRAGIAQKELDAQIVALKDAQNRRLRSEGLVAEQEALAAATAAKKSEIDLAQLREAIVRAQRSAETQLAAAALEVQLLEREREESRRQLALAETRADRAGSVTWILRDAGATVRKGDVLARIADLSSFRVVATISDVHASRLRTGQPVRVLLDRTTALGGTISAVDPRIENGVASFEVALDEPSHPRLRNNLRVDVAIVTGHRDHVLRVKRGVLRGGERDDVFVVRGERAVKQSVRFGLVGEEAIEIVDGLREGDAVIVSNMESYDERRELRIEGNE